MRLKIVKGIEWVDGAATEVELPRASPRFSIGRDPANDWVIPDRTLAVSARHCEILAGAAGPTLHDLSTNGSFVNGADTRLVGGHPLADGDLIRIGPFTLQVEGQGAMRSSTPIPIPIPVLACAQAQAPGSAPVLRGGDPAAMVAGSGGAVLLAALADEAELGVAGLLDALAASADADDIEEALTRIRQAPGPAPAGGAGSAPAPARAVAPSAAPAVAAAVPPAPPPAALDDPPRASADRLAGSVPSPGPDTPPPAPKPSLEPGADAVQALALTLGLAADALAGRSLEAAAVELGTIARVALAALQGQLELQAQTRRRIGSHGPAALAGVLALHPLRVSPTPQAALQELLAAGVDATATLQRADAELQAHHLRLLGAFEAAAARLGEVLAPNALARALPGPGDAAHQARLWALYARLWQGIGLAADESWAQGFVEAARLHLAAAYDDGLPR